MIIPNYCETCIAGEFYMAMSPICNYFDIDLIKDIQWLKEHGITQIEYAEFISQGKLVKDYCIPMKWAIAWIPNIARHDHVNARDVLEIHEHIFVNMKFFGLC